MVKKLSTLKFLSGIGICSLVRIRCISSKGAFFNFHLGTVKFVLLAL